MLCGIGGRTVDEAKQRMTFAEFRGWLVFRHMRGSLFVGNRLETGFALVASMISRAFGGKAEQIDFMPHADKPSASLNDVLKEFGGVRRG